ncbi:MAG: hypothetical protein QOG62_1177 [Thermoleophilaceae bacterium]|jgi:hypothetical protein|nr:hypothetical protein [Thermoleophilaceae bacterium]
MKTGAAVLLALLALGLTACGGSSTETTTASSTPATTPATPPADTAGTDTAATDTGEPGKYPAAARESFLSACTASAAQEQCQCALSYLEKNVPIDELVKAGLESSKGSMPKVLADAVAECT